MICVRKIKEHLP